jgi:hypothetical protein
MRFIFSIQDEQNILQEMSRNQHKSKLISQACAHQGKSKKAANWMASARRIGIRIMLLEQAFMRKN